MSFSVAADDGRAMMAKDQRANVAVRLHSVFGGGTMDFDTLKQNGQTAHVAL